MNDPKIRIASFDIGKKNFAQYVEDIDVTSLHQLEKEYKNLPKEMQRRVKGEMNSSIISLIERVYLSGKRVQIGVYDLRDDKTSMTLDMKTRINILEHLKHHRKLWDSCDIFVIEQQYFRTWSGGSRRNKGTEANVDAIKIAEGVLTWFLSLATWLDFIILQTVMQESFYRFGV